MIIALSLHLCVLTLTLVLYTIQHVCMYVCRSLAAGSITLPSREHKWTNMKGLKYNLTNNQAYVRNYVLAQARKMVMKQTNGLYPAPLKILEVGKVCTCDVSFYCGCFPGCQDRAGKGFT